MVESRSPKPQVVGSSPTRLASMIIYILLSVWAMIGIFIAAEIGLDPLELKTNSRYQYNTKQIAVTILLCGFFVWLMIGLFQTGKGIHFLYEKLMKVLE